MEEGNGEDFPPKVDHSEITVNNISAKNFRQLSSGESRATVAQQLPPHLLTQPPASPPLIQHVKSEPFTGRTWQTDEVKDCTSKKQKQCKCKFSRCLKLYCECFTSGKYCDGCNCVNCYNTVTNEAARLEAVETIMERNPHAFRSKNSITPHAAQDTKEELGKRDKGCHCKRSGCLKKYCECYQSKMFCSENCKCVSCKNFLGRAEVEAAARVEKLYRLIHVQKAANASITCAVGSSGNGAPLASKNSKDPEYHLGPKPTKDLPASTLPHLTKTINHVRTPQTSIQLTSGGTHVNKTAAGPSKIRYRSLLEGVIKPHDFKILCSVLVVTSAEAANVFADNEIAKNSETPGGKKSSSNLLSGDQLKFSACSLSGTHNDNTIHGDDVLEEMQMSPRTQSLMCDERFDSIFRDPCLPPEGSMAHNGLATSSSQSPGGGKVSEAYAEQERFILTHFQDCLERLISLGKFKEANCSLSVRHNAANASQIKRKNSQQVASTYKKLITPRVVAQRERREREKKIKLVKIENVLCRETELASQIKGQNSQQVASTYKKLITPRAVAQQARREREKNIKLEKHENVSCQETENNSGQLLEKPRFFPDLPLRRQAHAAAEREDNRIREAHHLVTFLNSVHHQTPPPIKIPIVPQHLPI